MSWPPLLHSSSWDPLIPTFVIDGVWTNPLTLPPGWGASWTLYNMDDAPTQVTIEGSDERFELIEIQYAVAEGDTDRVFLRRLPKETTK